MTVVNLLCVSDLHVGSTVGLWPKRHEIEGGGIYEANAYQQWLFDCWSHMVEDAQRIKPQIVVVNGDVVQGINNRDGQIIGATVSAQCSAALTLLEPLARTTEHLYIIRGTEYHDGRAADNIEVLARELGAVRDAAGHYTRWELYLNVGGPVLHFAHHVGGSNIPFYEPTTPLRDAVILLSELWRFYGTGAPNVRMVVRSHRHRYIHVDAPPDIQAVVTPSWQLKTAYGYKKASSLLPQIGYVWVEWDGVDLLVKPRIFTLPEIAVEEVCNADRCSGTVLD